MSLVEKQQQLIARLRVIEDPQERLAAIVARGRKWPGLPEHEREETSRVQGCVSPVWLAGTLEAGRCRYRAAAASPLVLGLVALLCELYDGGTPAEVAAIEPHLFEELGLARQLSPTRLHGLVSVRRAIREFAQSAPSA